MNPGDFARSGFARSGFEWDTGRRPSQARQPMAYWLKLLLWTLGILIGVPAVIAGLAYLVCIFILLGS